MPPFWGDSIKLKCRFTQMPNGFLWWGFETTSVFFCHGNTMEVNGTFMVFKRLKNYIKRFNSNVYFQKPYPRYSRYHVTFYQRSSTVDSWLLNSKKYIFFLSPLYWSDSLNLRHQLYHKQDKLHRNYRLGQGTLRKKLAAESFYAEFLPWLRFPVW